MTGPVIVAGSDGLAVRLVQELLAVGEAVVAVGRELEPRFRRHLEEEGVGVIDGDPRDISDLRLAGLDTAAGLAIVEQDDVGNLHAALAARGARPDIPLVVRMFNDNLGSRLGALFPDIHIISASAIAAPAFLAAALRTSQRIVVGNRAFDVRPLDADDDLDGVVPVALFDAEAGTASLFPRASPGVLALVADDEQVQEATAVELAVDELRQAASVASSLLTRIAALGRLFDRRLLALLAFVAIVVVAAALIWSSSTRYNLLDSAYFTITTVSTTGYGDITPLRESEALKIGVMALMLVGALSLALVYALITDAVVGVRLARSLGERPRPRRNHVVVLGLGRVGQRVIEELVALRIPCVAVERNEEAPGVHQARRLRVPVVISDVALPTALDGLFLDRARCVMVLTDDDAANLAAALNLRSLHAELRVVLRLFDHDLAHRVEAAFGIHVSRSVSSLAAPAFAAALTERRALATIPVGSQAVTVAELPPAVGRTVAELERAAAGEARVIALGPRWAPAPDDRIGSGDVVVAIGSPSGLAALGRA
jgi:Trk K+ transport system NAD-binding subunit